MSEPRYKIAPFPHQRDGVPYLIEHKRCLLGDEMGLGKTKQAIDGGQLLYELDEVDVVLVVTINASKIPWYDPEWGEIAINRWDGLPTEVTWLHHVRRTWRAGYDSPSARRLRWYVTNYEYIRAKDRYDRMQASCTLRTLLILDESSAVGRYDTQQSRACQALARRCGRVWMLNGTPTDHNLDKVYGQMLIIGPFVLGFKNHTQFLARHAVYGVPGRRWITSWTRVDEIKEKVKPYVLRRLKADHLSLPEKLPSVVMSAAMGAEAWRLYSEMKKDLVAWLTATRAVTAPQAVTRVLRLAQICSGFLGGIRDAVVCSCLETDGRPREDCEACEGIGYVVSTRTEEVDDGRFRTLLSWLRSLYEVNPKARVVVWHRFRPDLERTCRRIEEELGVPTLRLYGGQAPRDRESVLRQMHPSTADDSPVVCAGTTMTGAMAVNLASASYVAYMGNDPSLRIRLQSEDRVHRPGQTKPITYVDVVAEGPAGQKTVDHAILRALRINKDFADSVMEAWAYEED